MKVRNVEKLREEVNEFYTILESIAKTFSHKKGTGKGKPKPNPTNKQQQSISTHSSTSNRHKSKRKPN